MRKDVHLAALRAATRVALGITVLTGCSASGQDEAPVQDDEALHTKKETAAACTSDGGAPSFTCDDLVEAAFPKVGNYPGTKVTTTAAVKSCCHQGLVDKGGLVKHRWDCCANLDDDQKDDVMVACTPWGPPVPPAMKRRDVAARDSLANGVA